MAKRRFNAGRLTPATLDDGTQVAVLVHSGMVGEATRVQLRQADGSFTDLQPA